MSFEMQIEKFWNIRAFLMSSFCFFLLIVTLFLDVVFLLYLDKKFSR